MEYEQYLNAMQQQINANNSWSAEQAAKQMEFQERMSNTSHVREMADLKAAGLNPILSANSGATSPNGAMATSDGSNQAMASIIDRLLGIEADNAKANLVAATKSINPNVGYLNTSNSSTFNANEIAGIARLLGVPMTSGAAEALMKVSSTLGNNIANGLGLSNDSKLRDYLEGNWSLQDSINAVGQAYNYAKDTVQSFVSPNSGSAKSNYNTTYYGNDSGVHFKTSSATNIDNRSEMQKVVDTITNAGKALGKAISSNSTVKKGIKAIEKLLS